MDNLGLVFDTTNPFVNTGIPRTGQLYFRRMVPGCMVHIISYDEYNDMVAYKIIEIPITSDVVKLNEPGADEIYNKLFKGKILYTPASYFLHAFCFSH